MTDTSQSCAFVPIRAVEKFEESSFSLKRIAEYLGWKIDVEHDGTECIRSGNNYPCLRIIKCHRAEPPFIKLTKHGYEKWT